MHAKIITLITVIIILYRLCLLVRQSHIFLVREVLLVRIFFNPIKYRETYAQKVQCLKRLLGKGKCQDRRAAECVLCDPRCLESL